MTKNSLEYEEAPSGSVYFYNYKEPLMKFTEGFGFIGALVFDDTTDKIQCHFCGEWFDALGNHINREHGMRAAEYKKTVGLNISTALINERVRATLIQKGLARRMQNLKPGGKKSAETRAKISATLRENRAERKNIDNTCPEQLLSRLVELYNKLKRTPSRHEITFKGALIRCFGSFEEACRLAGIPYRKPGSQVIDRTGISREEIIDYVREFYKREGRFPEGRKELTARHYQLFSKFGRRTIFREAITREGVYHKTELQFSYTKDELLEFLRIFEKVNGRKPSYSDCRRGLLPHLSRYAYNFGSWKRALQEAFPA